MSHAYTFAVTKDTGNIALQMTLYVIAMHVNVETGKTFVGVRTLMEEARIKSDRTMRNYLAQLEELGLIKREKRKRNDGGNTTDNIELVGFLEWWKAHKGGESAARFTGGARKRQDLPGPPVGRLPRPPVDKATGHEHLSNIQLTEKRGSASPFEKKKLPSGSPRDTSIPFAEEMRRAIANGTYKPKVAQ